MSTFLSRIIREKFIESINIRDDDDRVIGEKFVYLTKDKTYRVVTRYINGFGFEDIITNLNEKRYAAVKEQYVAQVS